MPKTEKFWDRVAKRSAKPASQLSLTVRKIVARTRHYLSPDHRLLDFGCGPGTITVQIAPSVREVLGIDISREMINVARSKAEARNLRHVRFAQTTLFYDRLSPQSFDVVVAFNVLHYLEDLPSAPDRISDLLPLNGLFISSTACLRERRSFLRYLMRGLTQARIVPPTRFYSVAELSATVERAGFSILKAEKISGIPDYFLVAQKVP